VGNNSAGKGENLFGTVLSNNLQFNDILFRRNKYIQIK